jgi:hypothetical protein
MADKNKEKILTPASQKVELEAKLCTGTEHCLFYSSINTKCPDSVLYNSRSSINTC